MKAEFIHKSRPSTAMKAIPALAVLLLFLFGEYLEAAGPQQETLRAWDEYIRIVNLRVAKNASVGGHFLWIDESQDMARLLQKNEVLVTNRDPQNIPQGMIHDWVGAVFVPYVTLDQVLKVVGSYDRCTEFSKPLFSRCTILSRGGDQVELNVVAIQKVFSVTAAVEAEQQVQVVKLSPKRAYITSNAIQVKEIADYGRPTEHPFSENRRPGFVWREATVQRLEERDGGVYLELETIILSRDIPVGLRWLIKPLADELPRRLMLDVLNDTRTAVLRDVQLSPSHGLSLTASR